MLFSPIFDLALWFNREPGRSLSPIFNGSPEYSTGRFAGGYEKNSPDKKVANPSFFVFSSSYLIIIVLVPDNRWTQGFTVHMILQSETFSMAPGKRKL